MISGKLIIQKTLNRHHVRPVWFDQWIPRVRDFFRLEDEIRKKREEEDEKFMEKSRPTTRQKGCQSCGEAATRRGGRVPGGRSKTAGGGAAGSRRAGGREEEGGKEKLKHERRKAIRRMD